MRAEDVPAPVPSGRIPLVSPLLHCVAMPLLVIWRRKFGYSFLSPKSVFLSCAFASGLFSYMVCNDPWLKNRFLSVAIFTSFVSILYLLHLATSTGGQKDQTAPHDQDSGRSNIGLLFRGVISDEQERTLHWIESALSVVIGAVFWFHSLGRAVLICALSLALKEAISYWHSLRKKVRKRDLMIDAENDGFVQPSTPTRKPTAHHGRTEQQTFERNFERDENEDQRHAEILDLLPPYTLERAEEKFSALKCSFDTQTSEGREMIRKLSEAIEHFRRWA